MTFTHSVEVRYLEVDQQGVVFNMWYLAYLDDAMTAYLLAGGLPYVEMIEAGYDVQLVHTELDWVGSLGWGDRADIDVTTFALRIGRRPMLVCAAPTGRNNPVPARRDNAPSVSKEGLRDAPDDFTPSLSFSRPPGHRAGDRLQAPCRWRLSDRPRRRWRRTSTSSLTLTT